MLAGGRKSRLALDSVSRSKLHGAQRQENQVSSRHGERTVAQQVWQVHNVAKNGIFEMGCRFFFIIGMASPSWVSS